MIIADSSCSRESCSVCSDSSSENPQNSYSDQSESSSKEREIADSSRKYTYQKHPGNNRDLLFAPLDAHPSSNKIDHNMMSTSFNSSIVTLTTDDSNPSLINTNSDTFVASTAFRNSSRMSSKLPTLSITSQIRKVSIENPIDNSMTVEEIPICSVDENNVEIEEDDDFMSTPFKNPVQESDPMINVDPTNSSQSVNCIDVSNQSEKTASSSYYLKNSYGSSTHCKPAVLYDTDNNLMSTRFNKTELDEQSTIINPVSLEIPPPPSLTHSITGCWQNSYKKHNQFAKSTQGLLDSQNSIFQSSLAKGINIPPILHRPNSVSNIFTSSQKDNNLLPSRTYRFSYDLDYIPIYGSCDTLNNQSFTKINSINYQREFLKLGHSQNNTNLIVKKENPLPMSSTSFVKHPQSCSVQTDTSIVVNEKPKVKFSDTVTHILVPGKVRNIYSRI